MPALISKSPLPNDIDTSEPFFSTFGAHEADVAAQWIVRYCQFYGNVWQSFSHEEIESFYQARHGTADKFRFCCLIDSCDTDAYHIMAELPNKQPWIERMLDGRYRITKEFALRCYKKFPHNAL